MLVLGGEVESEGGLSEGMGPPGFEDIKGVSGLQSEEHGSGAGGSAAVGSQGGEEGVNPLIEMFKKR